MQFSILLLPMQATLHMRTCQHALPPAARLHRPAAPECTLQPALPLAAGALPCARWGSHCSRRSCCRRLCRHRWQLERLPLLLHLLAWLPLLLLLPPLLLLARRCSRPGRRPQQHVSQLQHRAQARGAAGSAGTDSAAANCSSSCCC